MSWAQPREALRSCVQFAMARSRWLFALRHHLGMVPAVLAGAGGGGRRSWSQHGEDDRIVADLRPFLTNGYYVDIGANHPAVLSNTYRLYCLGMRGISVEPHDILWRLHRRYRPGDVALCAAVGAEPGVSTYYELQYHGLSTFSEEACREKVDAGAPLVRQSTRPVLPLATILDSCRPAERDVFALLSVDTEGWDEPVLRGNDWERYRPRRIIVEQNTPDAAESTQLYLDQVAYRRIETYGCNALYADGRLSDVATP